MNRLMMMAGLLFCFSVFATVVWGEDVSGDKDKGVVSSEVLIGWGSEDISPPRPVHLRGQFYKRVSETGGDPIMVTAMAVESVGDDGKSQQAIMISCDLISITAEVQAMVREALAKRVEGFDVQRLFIGATHTHTGPSVKGGDSGDDSVMSPVEYRAFFVDKTAAAAAQAWKNRKKSGVSWGYGHAAVGFNRRMVYEDGSAQMYGRTSRDDFVSVEGYEDHGVNVLFTWDESENVTGMVVNLACPSQQNEHGMQVSADFWHEARAAIRARYGDAVFILPQCSAAGDQSPHVLINKKMYKTMLERKGVTVRQEIGNRIAAGVDEAYAGAKEGVKKEVVFRHEMKILDLPRRMVTGEEYEEARARITELEANEEMKADRKAILIGRSQRVIDRYEGQGDAGPYQMELHVMRMGDVAFATNPFELFLDFGTRIKARSAAVQTFVVQLACDSGGYVPTAKAVQGGGYGAEIQSNRVGAEGGQKLVDETVELIDGMWE